MNQLLSTPVSIKDRAPHRQVQLVADALSFPTSLAFDDEGTAYVAEAGLPFAGAKPGGRIWKIKENGSRSLLREGLQPPVNGLCWHRGWFYISEGGHPARLSRWRPGGQQQVILSGLPGPGNYHLNMAVVGPDEKLYFSHGAMTNTGIIGLDAYELGWLRRLPHAHDVPGYDITLAGVNVETADPVSGKGARTWTGAFAEFGTRSHAGQRIEGRVPCTASIMRCNLDGTGLELVSWGLRNAYGLCFLPDGRLLATDQGADDRGSRPVGNAPDLLFHIKEGSWYGWPDFVSDVPITDPRFMPVRGPSPSFLLANHRALPPPERALVEFPAHAGALKVAVIPAGAPWWGGQLLVALFGDERPMTAPAGAREGRCVARIDPETWALHPLVAEPLLRPIDIGFNPYDGALFVVDFGDFEMDADRGVVAKRQSGNIWRIPLSNL